MLVILYEGDPSDPLQQYMRLVQVKSLGEARLKYPNAASCQMLERSNLEQINIKKLKKGNVPVWSF